MAMACSATGGEGSTKNGHLGVRHWVNLKQRYHEVENCYIYIYIDT